LRILLGESFTLVDNFHRQVALIDGVTCADMSRKPLSQEDGGLPSLTTTRLM